MSLHGRRVKVTIYLRPEVYTKLCDFSDRVRVSLPQIAEGSIVRTLRREGVELDEQLERAAWFLRSSAPPPGR